MMEAMILIVENYSKTTIVRLRNVIYQLEVSYKSRVPFKFSHHILPFIPLFFTTALMSINWFGTPVPSDGNISAIGAAIFDLVPLPLLSALTFKAILSENKALTTGIILGLAIIFVVRYSTSPWRKLPPSPPRLPILGNALQLRDKTWWLSKDCKDRFGEFTGYNVCGVIKWVHGHYRRGYVSRRCWTANRCVQQS